LRIANGELDILNDKRAGEHVSISGFLRLGGDINARWWTELERDLELERRKVREVQEAAREKDKEYQRLKVGVARFDLCLFWVHCICFPLLIR